MNLAAKLSLAAAGFYLLAGMLIGVVKYRKTMTAPSRRAPVYVDIAHRAAFMYAFAALVMSRLLEFSPYPPRVQLGAAATVLAFFTLTILGYLAAGLRDETNNLFREHNFTTTWFMYALIAGEVGGFAVIFWGYLSTQIIPALSR